MAARKKGEPPNRSYAAKNRETLRRAKVKNWVKYPKSRPVEGSKGNPPNRKKSAVTKKRGGTASRAPGPLRSRKK